MVVAMIGRASLLLAFCVAHSAVAQYKIPDVKIEVFSPKGFRASIPDGPNIGLFVFQGNVNRKIDTNELGDIAGEAISPVDGRWVVDLPEVTLTAGDVIKYHVFVSVNSAGYLLDGQEYKVTDLVEYFPLPSHNTVTTTPAPAECRATDTTLRWGRACAGQTLFEENFNTLRDSLWQVEQYIPKEHSELPYVSYQSSAVTVQGGNLRITPSLQETQPGWSHDAMYNGVLQLTGCTESASCSRRTEGANIIPPIVSGRVTTRTRFAFTYGTITVRAKLPQGDWLYPEILLEPLSKKYGYGPLNYKSGVIKIACALGNDKLYAGRTDYGNTVLYGGPILGSECHDDLLTTKLSPGNSSWVDEFHVYSVKWTKDRISLSVDGVEWGTAPKQGRSGLRDGLHSSCQDDDATGLAPFDDHFYITLGVAAGGVTEFLDGLLTTTGLKPWTNRGSKSTLNFWKDLKNWHSTWKQPSLLVDYVKVVAL